MLRKTGSSWDPAAMETSMVVRNCWYVAAWDHEVLGDTLLERTVIGESLLVYRRADGSPVVLSNRCPHRQAPLSMGRKEGDAVRCMYHGLKFAPVGRCIEIPGQKLIPQSAFVRRYPAVERGGWMWIWILTNPTRR